jgi:Flp pilus assembly protein TadG
MAYLISLQKFKRSESGATAVEFALVSPLLVFIFMAIIEISLMFFASVTLDGAAIEAARRIRTGQAQQSADPQSDFATALCSKMDSIINCGAVYYDARTVSDYSAVTLGVQYDPITGEPITYGFNPGGSGAIVIVRVMYQWTINTPAIASLFESTPGTHKRMLSSTVVFQSEPYEVTP